MATYPGSPPQVQRYWITDDGMHLYGVSPVVTGVQQDPTPVQGN